MVRFFSLKNRNFRLDLERWREMQRKGKYLRYYLKTGQDGRNSLARQIDFYGPLAAVLLVTWALAAGLAGNYLKGLALSIPLAVLEVALAFKIRRVFVSAAAERARLGQAGRRCLERIRGIKSAGKLEKLVVEILGLIDGFSDPHQVREEKTGSVAVRALYRGLPIGVGCLLPDSDGRVAADRVVAFREQLSRLELKGGLIITTGAFSGEARRAAVEVRKSSRITLVDGYWLVELARETGHRVFTEDSAAAAVAREDRSKAYHRLFRSALTRERAKGYLYAAGMMLAMYYLFGLTGIQSQGYIAFALLNLCLWAYCLVSNRESDLLGPVKVR